MQNFRCQRNEVHFMNSLENKQLLRRLYDHCAEKHVLLERLFLSFFSLNHQKSWTGNVDENDWSVRFTLRALNITHSILFPAEFKCQHFPVWSPADLLRCVQRVSRGYSPQLFKRFLKTKDSWRRKNRSLPGHDYKWLQVLQLLCISLEKVVHPIPEKKNKGGCLATP